MGTKRNCKIRHSGNEYSLVGERRLLLLVLLFSFTCGLGFGQDFKTEIRDLRSGYENLQSLHVTMTISVFESAQVSKPFFEEKADIKRDGTNYSYRFGSIEMLMNDRCLIMVDHEARELVFSNRDVGMEQSLTDPVKMNLDSVLDLYGEPKLISASGGINHYRINQNKGLIHQVDIYLSSAKKLLQKIEYRYKDEQFVRINFDVFDKTPEFAASVFDDGYYVKLLNGKLIPGPRFKGFEIVQPGAESEF
jgi:outer membrane lipoprotein-sorting protein